MVLDRDFALAYVNRGNTKVYVEDYDGAVADYRRADALNVDSVLTADAVRAFYAAKESVTIEVERRRWQHVGSRNADLTNENSRIAAANHTLRVANEQLTAALSGRRQPTIEVPKTADSSRIQYCADDKGTNPYIDWLIGLDQNSQRRVRDAVSQMQLGNLGNNKSLRRDGLFERRLGSGLRIYFAKTSQASVVILGGGGKSDQQNDIDAASDRWADWLGRHRR